MLKQPLLILAIFVAAAATIVALSDKLWDGRSSLPVIRSERDLAPLSRVAMYVAHGECPKALEELRMILARDPSNQEAQKYQAECQARTKAAR